jgi:aldose 1-epimerase
MNKKILLQIIAALAMITAASITRAGTIPGRLNHNTMQMPSNIAANFNAVIDGKHVNLFELKNKRGMAAYITNYGGRLVSLLVPDKHGKMTDVVQGFNGVKGYQKSTEPYFGATIGRYGNRIANGKFVLDNQKYTLYKNNGPNTLHGGKKGFQDVVWDAKQVGPSSIELTYLSKDMEEGFPGNLKVKVIYKLTEDNALKISYEASTDKSTVINLTNHAFFNLNGENSGSILNHRVQIKADRFLPVNATLIPTGVIENVAGTPFDFRRGATIGSRINDHSQQLGNGKGYDHNYVLNTHNLKTSVANIIGDKSGIVMDVFTDQPGLQFYSGNFMQSKNIMKEGHKDEYRTAFAVETQHFPDSPNQPAFPSTVLKRGQQYYTVSIYRFKVEL